jgi:phage shock protein A
MSLWQRIKMFFHIKTNAALDRTEDPRQVMAYASAQQEEFLRTVRRGLIDVATAKEQLEQHIRKQRGRIPKLEAQAQQALALGREDLARTALTRKQTALAELTGLETQAAEVGAEERKLIAAERAITERIAAFRTHRQVANARYTAAESQVRIQEAFSGVSSELSELSMALGRAEEKTGQMLARASALDSLIEGGALEFDALGGGDRVDQELQKLASAQAVEVELAALKAPAVAGQLAAPAVVDQLAAPAGAHLILDDE